ncbi:permease prefix domain 1-containing protein [Capsulimonas corticalis]|uniref:permease prefix domain 1-containing protein n=1 Tax=Capsulimonas corticalis TaxID=2219043 RepID=UPI000E648156|nr:permease prefix domain 1-containing protein [Capsulimonas corticalis]
MNESFESSEQIDQYLSRVADYLHGADAQVVDDTLEEIRQHLNLRCEELIQNGLSDKEAVRIAIERFGSPNKIGWSLARQLGSSAFQIQLFCGLTTCRMLKFLAIFLPTRHTLHFSPFITKFIPFGLGLVICITLLQLIEAFTVINSQSARKQRSFIKRTSQGSKMLSITSTATPTGVFRYAYIAFLLAWGGVNFSWHINSLGALTFLEVIEFTFVRTAIRRLSGSASV